MLQLRHQTPAKWIAVVGADLVRFLSDHAHNERKVSSSAMQLAMHNPQRLELVDAMVDLAREELGHFKQVYDLLRARGGVLGYDQPDPYMTPMRKMLRKADKHPYLLDRLLLFAVIEARGLERFEILANGLEDLQLRAFYGRLAKAERRHQDLFVELANHYFDHDEVANRLDEILDREAVISASLALRSALH